MMLIGSSGFESNKALSKRANFSNHLEYYFFEA